MSANANISELVSIIGIVLIARGGERAGSGRERRQSHNKDIISPAALPSPEGDESLDRLTLKRQIEELPSRSPPGRGKTKPRLPLIIPGSGSANIAVPLARRDPMHISAKTLKTKIFPPGGRPYFFPLAPIKHAVNAFLFSRPHSNRKANYELTGADGWRCTKPPRCLVRPATTPLPPAARHAVYKKRG